MRRSDKSKFSICTKNALFVESATVPTYNGQPRWTASRLRTADFGEMLGGREGRKHERLGRG